MATTSDQVGSAARAVILLSGGLDSTTTLALAAKEGFHCYALTVDYGQRHRFEIEQARNHAGRYGVQEHKIIKVELNQFGGSALTTDMAVPDGREQPSARDIPLTYVPARNTVLLSLGLAWAEVLNAKALFIGANAVDYSGYPDCRPEFLEAFEKVAKLGTKAGVTDQWALEIRAPLIRMSKAEIIKLGVRLGVDFHGTSSCYNPKADGSPCGQCESCLLRAKGFEEAGMRDGLISSPARREGQGQQP